MKRKERLKRLQQLVDKCKPDGRLDITRIEVWDWTAGELLEVIQLGQRRKTDSVVEP